MADAEANHDGQLAGGYAVIAGFGVPGRAVADWLTSQHVPFCVIELNPATVHRCSLVGVHMISGDACDEQVLRNAEVERATLILIAIPNDSAVLETVRVARRLNPRARIIARCRFISSGMEAHRRGADEVVIEEQVVALDFTRLLGKAPAAAPSRTTGSTAPATPP